MQHPFQIQQQHGSGLCRHYAHRQRLCAGAGKGLAEYAARFHLSQNALVAVKISAHHPHGTRQYHTDKIGRIPLPEDIGILIRLHLPGIETTQHGLCFGSIHAGKQRTILQNSKKFFHKHHLLLENQHTYCA